MGAFSTDKRGEKKMFENLQNMGVSEMMLWIAVGASGLWLMCHCLGRLLSIVFGRHCGTDAGFGLVLLIIIISFAIPVTAFFTEIAIQIGRATVVEGVVQKFYHQQLLPNTIPKSGMRDWRFVDPNNAEPDDKQSTIDL